MPPTRFGSVPTSGGKGSRYDNHNWHLNFQMVKIRKKLVNKLKEWGEVAEVPSNIAKNDDNADTINPFIAATDDMRSVVIYIV